MTNDQNGKLYIVGTPIGNLEDITFRALRILQNVDVIYAEDTRHSIKLLTHFEISKPLYSYHEHNKLQVTPDVLAKLRKGDQVALVSDAGMPGISDPGADLIKVCIEEGVDFEIIPGVTAFTTALVGSGLDTRQFSFKGFLNRDKKLRTEQLEALKYQQETLIFYESPHRLKETLKAMSTVLGERQAVLAKELTKRYESYFRGVLTEILDAIPKEALKGEWVILIEGSSEAPPEPVQIYDDMTLEAHLEYYLAQNMTKKEAIKQIALDRKMKKSDVYNALV